MDVRVHWFLITGLCYLFIIAQVNGQVPSKYTPQIKPLNEHDIEEILDSSEDELSQIRPALVERPLPENPHTRWQSQTNSVPEIQTQNAFVPEDDASVLPGSSPILGGKNSNIVEDVVYVDDTEDYASSADPEIVSSEKTQFEPRQPMISSMSAVPGRNYNKQTQYNRKRPRHVDTTTDVQCTMGKKEDCSIMKLEDVILNDDIGSAEDTYIPAESTVKSQVAVSLLPRRSNIVFPPQAMKTGPTPFAPPPEPDTLSKSIIVQENPMEIDSQEEVIAPEEELSISSVEVLDPPFPKIFGGLTKTDLDFGTINPIDEETSYFEEEPDVQLEPAETQVYKPKMEIVEPSPLEPTKTPEEDAKLSSLSRQKYRRNVEQRDLEYCFELIRAKLMNLTSSELCTFFGKKVEKTEDKTHQKSDDKLYLPPFTRQAHDSNSVNMFPPMFPYPYFPYPPYYIPTYPPVPYGNPRLQEEDTSPPVFNIAPFPFSRVTHTPRMALENPTHISSQLYPDQLTSASNIPDPFICKLPKPGTKSPYYAFNNPDAVVSCEYSKPVVEDSSDDSTSITYLPDSECDGNCMGSSIEISPSEPIYAALVQDRVQSRTSRCSECESGTKKRELPCAENISFEERNSRICRPPIVSTQCTTPSHSSSCLNCECSSQEGMRSCPRNPETRNMREFSPPYEGPMEPSEPPCGTTEVRLPDIPCNCLECSSGAQKSGLPCPYRDSEGSLPEIIDTPDSQKCAVPCTCRNCPHTEIRRTLEPSACRVCGALPCRCCDCEEAVCENGDVDDTQNSELACSGRNHGGSHAQNRNTEACRSCNDPESIACQPIPSGSKDNTGNCDCAPCCKCGETSNCQCHCDTPLNNSSPDNYSRTSAGEDVSQHRCCCRQCGHGCSCNCQCGPNSPCTCRSSTAPGTGCYCCSCLKNVRELNDF